MEKYKRSLLNPDIYGEHNHVKTIEFVFVRGLRQNIKIWENIAKQTGLKEDKKYLQELKAVLSFYRDNMIYLRGVELWI